MVNTASADDTTPDRVNRAAADDQTAMPGGPPREDPGCDLIMKFDSLTPVTSPHANSAGTVRGVAGGGLPWVLETGSGLLNRDGHLIVRIRGLVLARDPSVPDSMRGTNPFPAFRAVVSCLTTGADGATAIANISTGDFEANSRGNCDIDARVGLPQRCTAPIVLVTGPGGADFWLAVTRR